ncbi:uncharacterized protein LOC135397604 isoform X2 [Ornithodoros turicata]
MRALPRASQPVTPSRAHVPAATVAAGNANIPGTRAHLAPGVRSPGSRTPRPRTPLPAPRDMRTNFELPLQRGVRGEMPFAGAASPAVYSTPEETHPVLFSSASPLAAAEDHPDHLLYLSVMEKGRKNPEFVNAMTYTSRIVIALLTVVATTVLTIILLLHATGRQSTSNTMSYMFLLGTTKNMAANPGNTTRSCVNCNSEPFRYEPTTENTITDLTKAVETETSTDEGLTRPQPQVKEGIDCSNNVHFVACDPRWSTAGYYYDSQYRKCKPRKSFGTTPCLMETNGTFPSLQECRMTCDNADPGDINCVSKVALGVCKAKDVIVWDELSQKCRKWQVAEGFCTKPQPDHEFQSVVECEKN